MDDLFGGLVMRKMLLAAGVVLGALAGYNEPARASCNAIDLPTASGMNSVTFTNAISYSLPILGLNYQSSPGQIQNCIVIQTGSGGQQINTNGPGIDNAYPAVNGTSTDPFNETPYFSTAAAYGTVALPGSNPTFAGQTPNTWDISVSALESFLVANGGAGSDPIIMFNHNQTNSGGTIDQNLFIWAQVALVNSTTGAATYFYVAAENSTTGLPNFGQPGGSTNNVGPQTAYNPADYPIGSDATGFPSGGVCGVTGTPACGTSGQYMVDALGQVCLNGPVGSGTPIACDGSQGPVVATVNENLGANQVANAVVIPGLDAILNNPAALLAGGYDTIRVALVEGCNEPNLSTNYSGTPLNSNQVDGCPAGSPLNNGFEQIFIVPGALGLPPSIIPEPASLILFGSGLIGFGWLARRRRKTA